MDWLLFGKWYIIGCIPIIFLASINIIDRIKFRDCCSVRVSSILNSICILSLFVSLLGWLANYIDGFDPDDSWFVPMMFICYALMIAFCFIMYYERIICDKENGDIVCYINFKKTKINVSEITRFNFSDEFIDIYIKEKRIRYRNRFLTGTSELEQYLKECWNKK